jgi:hypothetical protein
VQATVITLAGVIDDPKVGFLAVSLRITSAVLGRPETVRPTNPSPDS